MPRTTKPLTNTEVERSKPKEKEYSLSDGNGLTLRIKPNGSKPWLFNYYHPITKKRTNAGLGTYPALSLAQARSIREEYRSFLAQDIAPQEHKERQQKAAVAHIENSLLAVAERWKAKKAQEVEELTLKKNWRRMETYLFPFIGDIPVDEITPRTVMKALESLDNQGKGDCSGTLIPHSLISDKISSTRGFYNEKSKTFFQPGVQ
ncbi:integrase arm-type DNA-binding domain-containing protein, partial [Aggregatibacter actinomycetemcomitans]